ncbi:MAG: LysM peptidoglycan-binding domain-containing protein, partial [Bacteroidales bacterium]
ARFIDQQDKIFAYKDSIYFNPAEMLKEPTLTKYAYKKRGKFVAPNGYAVVTYRVKEGDNLGIIASWFNCRVNDILDWNELYSSRIRVGQKLHLVVPANKASYYRKIDLLSFEEKQQLKNGKIGQVNNSESVIVNTSSSPSSRTKKSKQGNANGNIVYYTVKQGDTLWEIARKYPGITLKDLREWNNLPPNAHIVPGQQLIIKTM